MFNSLTLKEQNRRLSLEDAEKIKNWGERVFAVACLRKENLIIYYQIGVDESVIDFLVVNTQVRRKHSYGGNGVGKLVEVTATPKEKAHGQSQKNRQLKRMNKNGSGTLICGEALSRLSRVHGIR